MIRYHACSKIQEKLKATGKAQLTEDELHEVTDQLESDKFRDQALNLYEVHIRPDETAKQAMQKAYLKFSTQS